MTVSEWSVTVSEWSVMVDDAGTISKKSAGAGHRAVSLHRDCVLVISMDVTTTSNAP